MDNALSLALDAPLDDAVRATQAAAASEAFARASALVGAGPDAASGIDPEQRNLPVSLLAFRIEHAAGLDPLGSVVGLRRWGVTWDTIGQVVGMSRQAAHTRWGARVRAVLDRYGTGDLGGPVADDESDLDG